MRDFALIQLTPGRLLVGWGPFRSVARLTGPPAFYVNDFFLSDPAPWKVPESWEIVDTARLSDWFAPASPPRISWETLDDASFQSLFSAAHSAIVRGDFDKVVPVELERGVVATDEPLARWLVGRIPPLPPRLIPYGWSIGDEGMIGATPETLFSVRDRCIQTMALAGTRAPHRSSELLDDPKERAEHQMVVDDIVTQLAGFGRVSVGETGVAQFAGIAHLETRIDLQPRVTAEFDEIVRALHPTAALGASPRNDAARSWLRKADEGIDRRHFGAPFGAIFPGGDALCLVAIRNVAWKGDEVRIGAGAGVLAESRMEMERKELGRKREQVRLLFGLPGEEG